MLMPVVQAMKPTGCRSGRIHIALARVAAMNTIVTTQPCQVRGAPHTHHSRNEPDDEHYYSNQKDKAAEGRENEAKKDCRHHQHAAASLIITALILPFPFRFFPSLSGVLPQLFDFLLQLPGL